MALGKYNEALIAYGNAVSIEPSFLEAWNCRGEALERVQNYDQALAAYDKVIKMSFEQGVSVAKVGLQRGAALEKLERYPEAIEAYNLVIEKQPNNFDGWLNRGLNLEKMANYEEAVLSYSRAISIWPSNYQAWLQLALMLEKLERLDEAIVAYDKIISLRPGNHETCLLYTSPSPRDYAASRMPSSA